MTARHGIDEFSHRERLNVDRQRALRLLDTADRRARDEAEARRLSLLRLFVLTGHIGQRAS